MSDAGLSDRDLAVLDAASSGSSEVSSDDELLDELPPNVQKVIREQDERIQELEDQLEAQEEHFEAKIDALRDSFKGLAAAVNRSNDQKAAELDERDFSSKLMKYDCWSRETQDEHLGSAEIRALVLYENWDALSDVSPSGRVVSTKRSSTAKNNPSKLKIQYVEHLQEADEEFESVDVFPPSGLHWNQIYAAMKALARLSGGERDQDEFGRTHIVGGQFEFHEKATPDASSTYKVLREVP